MNDRLFNRNKTIYSIEAIQEAIRRWEEELPNPNWEHEYETVWNSVPCEELVDKLNKVGNINPVTSGDIARALRRQLSLCEDYMGDGVKEALEELCVMQESSITTSPQPPESV